MIRPPGEDEVIRSRQRKGARVMGLLLGGFAILIFLITVAKQLK